MRYLTVEEILDLHDYISEQSGGGKGLRDPEALLSAAAQPRAAFGGQELYPTLPEKASALAHALALNHPFLDGNKRLAHAALETFLLLNGFELSASVDDQEEKMLSLAAGNVSREELASWVRDHLKET